MNQNPVIFKTCSGSPMTDPDKVADMASKNIEDDIQKNVRGEEGIKREFWPYPLTLLLKLTRLTLLIALVLAGLVLAGWIQSLYWVRSREQVSERNNTIRLSLKKWWLSTTCRIMGVKVHLKGGPWTSPVLMVCNHISWLDIPVLGANASFHFLAKAEIRQWPIIGWLADVTGTLFIHRRSGDSDKVNRNLSRYLNLGNNVLIFPEGTTSNGQQVHRFHNRLLKSAINNHVALQPITIAYSEAGRPHTKVPFINDDSLAPSIWKLLGEKSIHVHLHYHPPITAFEEDSRQLARQAHASVEKGLKAIFPLSR